MNKERRERIKIEKDTLMNKIRKGSRINKPKKRQTERNQ